VTPATEGAVALAYGALSALVPVVNAEVYAVAAAARDTGPVTTLVVVLALAAGQTAGKVVIFEAARLGGSRFARRRAARAATDRRGRWSARIVGALRSRRTGLPLVLCSAAVGLPPLAAVSAAAGVSGQRRWEFAVTCLVGRSIRFAALALPAGWLLL
jgi:membrane protein YqaA with SNARE-associated domain